MRIKKILASEIAALDSDVLTGGGTDDTEALQKALDEALTCGGVHLVMDGAALIRGLRVHSNTTIECLSKDCGFYLADDSNCAVVTNADWQMYHLSTRNVTLIGGTYNHNCLHQLHHLREKPGMRPGTPFSDMQCVFAMEFYGVENLLVRDLVIRNQRTYAFMCACFKKVTIEDVWLDLIDYMPRNNQDGFHFWGPGQFLTVRNVGGRVGDDFMNIGPDEHDMKSSITDVLVDGVFLDDADQAIRLLTRDQGRLDRVTIRNVTGVYHGLGFYINPWFTDGHFGNFGSLTFENIDLRPLDVHYINDPFLFAVGANVENMVVKNVRWHRPDHKYNLFQIGRASYSAQYDEQTMMTPKLQTLIIDGLTIDDSDQNAADAEYIRMKGNIGNLILRDIDILRTEDVEPCGTFLKTYPGSNIDTLLIDRINTQKLDKFLDLADGTVGTISES